jgi:hypothetical protein
LVGIDGDIVRASLLLVFLVVVVGFEGSADQHQEVLIHPHHAGAADHAKFGDELGHLVARQLLHHLDKFGVGIRLQRGQPVQQR